jgi:cell wall-associated NlpC family hydrolase
MKPDSPIISSRPRTRFAQAAIASLLSLVMTLGSLLVANTAQAAPETPQLTGGEELRGGERLVSPSGNMVLAMQTDGNLVLYAPGGNVRWHTDTDGNPGAFARFQTDGNLVVYSASMQPLWHAAVDGQGASFAQVQDDGNFVLYRSDATPVWYTGTKYFPSRLTAHGEMRPGDHLMSPNGAFDLVLQTDGNLVLYGPAGWTWQSGTRGSNPDRLVLQTDGNLVMYGPNNSVIWQTYTHTRGPGFMQVQDDGNFVLYTNAQQATWQTYTYAGYQPPVTPTPPAPSLPSKAQAAINYATAQLGKPYLLGAEGPTHFDCSGLTMRAWEAAGVSIRRSSAQQYASLPKIPFSQKQPGDLIFWHNGSGTIRHVALYVGNGRMIEAVKPGVPTRLINIYTTNIMPTVGRPG